MAIKELKDTSGKKIVVKAGASTKVTATLKDYDETAINGASILTLTMSLLGGDGEFIQRGGVDIDELDVKNDNGGYVAVDGTLSLYLSADDNTLVDPNAETELRIVRLAYTWNDGVDADNQVGIEEFQYEIDSTSDVI